MYTKCSTRSDFDIYIETVPVYQRVKIICGLSEMFTQSPEL